MIKDQQGKPTHAKENQIIEYINGFWTVVYDPTEIAGVSIVGCMADDLIKNLYIYDKNERTWVDYINKHYKSGYFRFWLS